MSWQPEEQLSRRGSQQGHRPEVKARLDFAEGCILEEPDFWPLGAARRAKGAKLGGFGVRKGSCPTWRSWAHALNLVCDKSCQLSSKSILSFFLW